MATMLYETLGLSREASLEEIRKAYKKRALQTHPDRLPQGSTPEDKANSEEQFRLVNNAYEILSDPQKRKAYDKHGVFPPPQPERDPRPNYGRRHYSRGDRFEDPFMSHGFSFTDPFTLFEEIFGKEFPEWHRHRPHFHGHSRFMEFDPFFSPFSNPFIGSSRGMDGLLANMERDIFGFPSHNVLSSRAFPPLESPSHHRRERGIMQESYVTQTINGVTQSIHKRIDMEGNEHVTRNFPDGRKVYTVNGVEQPFHGHLHSTELKDQRHLLADCHDSRASAPSRATAVVQPQPIHVTRSSYTSSAPPPYPTYETSAPPDLRYRDYENHYGRK
ncbi:hypothetical protein AX15_004215 [Amanita polypyramis BW_CC]|nr:hypothetical protein AX15_004215 [Amanita polypyramis BW_CC]